MVRGIAALGLIVLLTAASLVAAQSEADRITITGDEILFTVDEISYFTGFDAEDAEVGLLMLIEGDLLADEDRCVHGYDFALMLDDVKYEASTSWMNKLKEFAGGVDYPGWGLWGQCFDADEETPTFLVFDIPTEIEDVELRFFEGVHVFEDWSPATALPTITPTKTATRTPTKTPTPRPTRTPGMNDATRMAQSYNTGLTEAWEAIDGVASVNLTFVIEGEATGEVCVENGLVNEQTAILLYLVTKDFLNVVDVRFSVIISDENEAADFGFDPRDDEWVVTSLSMTGCK